MKRILLLLPAVFFFIACHHVYYAPNTANLPLLSQKAETRVNVLYASGSDSEFGGGELQAAHAITDRLGIMLNFFAAGKSETVDSYNGSSSTSHVEKGNGTYAEGAVGYFTALDAKRKWIAEVYGGLGFGGVKNEYENRDFSKVGIFKLFLQPAIGYKSANFEIGFSPKLSVVNWKVKQETIGAANTDALDDVAAVKADRSFFAFEPAVLLRAGGKQAKLHLGLSFSGYHPSRQLYSEEITESLNGSIGISINILPAK